MSFWYKCERCKNTYEHSWSRLSDGYVQKWEVKYTIDSSVYGIVHKETQQDLCVPCQGLLRDFLNGQAIPSLGDPING